MVFTWHFLLVADVEVKGDGVFIRLRKEEVVSEDKDSAKEVSSSVSDPVVEEVPEIGSEVTVHLEAIPEDLIFLVWRGLLSGEGGQYSYGGTI